MPLAHVEERSQRRRRGRTGCITCRQEGARELIKTTANANRIRRVKCDEGKPFCTRCVSTGRKCDGYSTPTPPPPVAFLVAMTDSGRAECQKARAAFQFFYEICAPALVNYGSQFFWNGLVLQACHSDESIKHLVIAVSYLESRRRQAPFITMDSQSFLIHYCRALWLLSHAREPDTAVMLMACLLLVICDEFQHNSYAALQHIAAGRKILAAHRRQRQSGLQNLAVNEIAPIFSRLELHSGEFDWETLPNHLRCPLPSGEPGRSALQMGRNRLPPPPSSHQGFDTVLAAAESLQKLVSCCMARRPNSLPPSTRFHVVSSATAQLNEWFTRFNTFMDNLDPEIASSCLTEIYILKLYRLCLHVISRCTPFGSEALFDLYGGDLETIIKMSSFWLASATPVLPIPLFFVATRYRDASSRRWAIALLRQCGEDGKVLAKIAHAVVKIEEHGVAVPIASDDIPERNRITLVGLSLWQGMPLLHYRRFPYGDSTPVETVELSNLGWHEYDSTGGQLSLVRWPPSKLK